MSWEYLTDYGDLLFCSMFLLCFYVFENDEVPLAHMQHVVLY